MKTDLNAHLRDALTPLVERLCSPRFGRLEEVVAPILFLASPAASYITGTIIDADGGYNIQSPPRRLPGSNFGECSMKKPGGKIALVTGGSSGIGLATARLLVEKRTHNPPSTTLTL